MSITPLLRSTVVKKHRKKWGQFRLSVFLKSFVERGHVMRPTVRVSELNEGISNRPTPSPAGTFGKLLTPIEKSQSWGATGLACVSVAQQRDKLELLQKPIRVWQGTGGRAGVTNLLER